MSRSANAAAMYGEAALVPPYWSHPGELAELLQ
jgi:hypothetical protein